MGRLLLMFGIYVYRQKPVYMSTGTILRPTDTRYICLPGFPVYMSTGKNRYICLPGRVLFTKGLLRGVATEGTKKPPQLPAAVRFEWLPLHLLFFIS